MPIFIFIKTIETRALTLHSNLPPSWVLTPQGKGYPGTLCSQPFWFQWSDKGKAQPAWIGKGEISIFCYSVSIQAGWEGQEEQLRCAFSFSFFPPSSVNKGVFLPLLLTSLFVLFCFLQGWFLLLGFPFLNYWMLFPQPNCLQLLFCLLYLAQKGMKRNESWKRNQNLQ